MLIDPTKAGFLIALVFEMVLLSLSSVHRNNEVFFKSQPPDSVPAYSKLLSRPLTTHPCDDFRLQNYTELPSIDEKDCMAEVTVISGIGKKSFEEVRLSSKNNSPCEEAIKLTSNESEKENRPKAPTRRIPRLYKRSLQRLSMGKKVSAGIKCPSPPETPKSTLQFDLVLDTSFDYGEKPTEKRSSREAYSKMERDQSKDFAFFHYDTSSEASAIHGAWFSMHNPERTPEGKKPTTVEKTLSVGPPGKPREHVSKQDQYLQELYGPLTRMHKVVDARLSWDHEASSEDLVEAFRELRYNMKTAVEGVLDQADITLFKTIRRIDFANFRDQIAALDLLEDVQELYIQTKNFLDRLPVIDLSAFSLTLDVLGSLRYEVVLPYAQQLETQIRELVISLEDRLYPYPQFTGKSHRKGYSSQNMNVADTPSKPNQLNEERLAEVWAPIKPKKGITLWKIAACKKHLSSILHDMKEHANQLREPVSHPSNIVPKLYDALGLELLAFRTHLWKIGASQNGGRGFGTGSQLQGVEKVDTALQDMFISTEIIQSLQLVLSRNHCSMRPDKASADQIVFSMAEKLRSVSSRISNELANKLESYVDYSTTSLRMMSDTTLADLSWGVLDEVIHTPEAPDWVRSVQDFQPLSQKMMVSLKTMLDFQHASWSSTSILEVLTAQVNELSLVPDEFLKKKKSSLLATILNSEIIEWQQKLQNIGRTIRISDHTPAGVKLNQRSKVLCYSILEHLSERIAFVYHKLGAIQKFT